MEEFVVGPGVAVEVDPVAANRHTFDRTLRNEYSELLGMMQKTKAMQANDAAEERQSGFSIAGFFSRLCFAWIMPMMTAIVSGEVTADALILPEKDRTSASSDVFRRAWNDQLATGNPSLSGALYAAFYPKFNRAFVVKLAWGVIMVFTNSFLVKFFIQTHYDYVQGFETESWLKYFYAALFFVFPCALGYLLHHFESMTIRLGIRIRAALITLIYHKAMTAKVTNSHISGILSILTKDCGVMLYAPINFIRLVTGIIEIILLTAALAVYLRWDALVWIISVTFVCIPAQYLLSQKVTKIREANFESNNDRLLIVHEVLYAIKLVKFYCWENSFSNKVSDLRKGELAGLKTAAVVKSTNYMIIIVHNIVCSVGAFLLYALSGRKLSPMISFMLVNTCNSYRFPIFYLPVAIKTCYEAFHSMKRIRSFLLEEDRPPVAKAEEDGVYFTDVEMSHIVLESEDAGAKVADENKFVLKGVNFAAKRGDVLAVIGPFGSGKSSVLQGILGDMQVVKGSLAIKGSIAYVPQTPWIMHGTVRDNILFGKAYEKEWYLKVVRACCLIPDLRQMQEYDLSHLSEGGINLSGGQRQRVALARAVYAKADIYLLDSVLSALDPETGRTIFDRVVKGLLKESAVIMVTHNLDCIPDCDNVLVLNSEGAVGYCGPYNAEAVAKVFPESLSHRSHEEKAVEGAEAKDETGAGTAKTRKPSNPAREHQVLMSMLKDSEDSKEDETGELLKKHKKLVRVSSMRSQGSHKDDADETGQSAPLLSSFWQWALAGNAVGVIFSALLFFVSQSVRVFMDFWLRFWLNDVLGWGTSKDASLKYVGVYAILLVVFAVLCEVRAILWYVFSFRAATKLHDSFLMKISHAPMLFFSKEPLGKILKAYSKDQDQVDDAFPDSMHFMLFFSSIVLTTIISLCIVNQWFILLGGVVFVCWILLQWRFSNPINICKNSVSRTDGVALVHASETLHGMPVIRAFGVENIMARESEVCLDAHGSAIFHLEHITLWSALIFDLVASLFVFFTAMICIWQADSLTTAQVGQLLAGSTQLLVFLALMVNMINDSQYQLFSVARIIKYLRDTPQEKLESHSDESMKAMSVLKDNQGNFPGGEMELKEVEMAYDPHKGLVLKKVSGSIKAGERIGIVGRTGSGKSSLINALFRLTELHSGKIEVDGLDTSLLSMKALRSAMCIIPQEPVVFRGTIRSNLDPFGEYSDEALKESLKASHLLETIEALPKGLDTEVTEGGSNLSVGQRQLLCLSRVVLRKDRRILVLDEATSALDPVTDQLIQKTLREVFNDHTVLTIAHRLETIIDYDRILVLGHGELLEFDKVDTLLANPYGHFRKMYDAGGNPDSV